MNKKIQVEGKINQASFISDSCEQGKRYARYICHQLLLINLTIPPLFVYFQWDSIQSLPSWMCTGNKIIANYNSNTGNAFLKYQILSTQNLDIWFKLGWLENYLIIAAIWKQACFKEIFVGIEKFPLYALSWRWMTMFLYLID